VSTAQQEALSVLYRARSKRARACRDARMRCPTSGIARVCASMLTAPVCTMTDGSARPVQRQSWVLAVLYMCMLGLVTETYWPFNMRSSGSAKAIAKVDLGRLSPETKMRVPNLPTSAASCCGECRSSLARPLAAVPRMPSFLVHVAS